MKRNIIGTWMIGGIIAIIVTQTLYHEWYLEGKKPLVYQAEASEIQLIEKKHLVRAETETERITRKIKEAFPDEPRMLKVAFAESGWDSNGDGIIELHPDAYNTHNGSNDCGVFQISQKYHGKEMRNLGLDCFDVDDNLEFARILYDRNGLKDWVHSSSNWMK